MEDMEVKQFIIYLVFFNWETETLLDLRSDRL